MDNAEQVERYQKTGRTFEKAKPFDDDLGPLKLLPGTWSNEPGLEGRGWNIIALPFATDPPPAGFNYRVLMNQYNEELTFAFVDKGVPNRGIRFDGTTPQTDQRVVTLDYQQQIKQIAAEDFPVSGEAGGPDLAIHHEPGLFLHMLNFRTNDLDIARCATIPHGDSALALGKSKVEDGAPKIPQNIDALPVGVPKDLANPYLSPYKHFVDDPFKGVLEGAAGFPGFLPTDTTALLQAANEGVDIVRTTELNLDTALESGGIANIPFVVKQANAADMKSIFWIQELAEMDEHGHPKLRLQYLQVVMLDFFFPRRDAQPGAIRWPHISINTMQKVSSPPPAV